MTKRIIIPGLLGGVTLTIVTFIINGIFGFNSSINMKQIPNERQVYEILKEQIVEPGRYSCNPETASSERFPDGKLVFSILYGGMGHEAAGRLSLIGLFIFFISPTIGSWMLSVTSERILYSYFRKVFFFSVIGLLFALFGDLNNYGIGNYPLNDTILLALHKFFVWTIVGLVVGWKIKPNS
jgi:hypothetical protein